jgi:hypothetical protein
VDFRARGATDGGRGPVGTRSKRRDVARDVGNGGETTASRDGRVLILAGGLVSPAAARGSARGEFVEETC